MEIKQLEQEVEKALNESDMYGDYEKANKSLSSITIEHMKGLARYIDCPGSTPEEFIQEYFDSLNK